MDVTFRNLEPQHLTEVKFIYDWYIMNSTATFHTEPIEINELREFIFIDHPLYPSFLIDVDQEIAGYCFLTYYKKRQAYNRTAEITIYLKPEFHGKGIGKIAVKHLEKKAREIGLKNLIAIVTGDNTQSISLFEKSGYLKCASFKNVGEKFNRILDVVAFQKELYMPNS